VHGYKGKKETLLPQTVFAQRTCGGRSWQSPSSAITLEGCRGENILTQTHTETERTHAPRLGSPLPAEAAEKVTVAGLWERRRSQRLCQWQLPLPLPRECPCSCCPASLLLVCVCVRQCCVCFFSSSMSLFRSCLPARALVGCVLLVVLVAAVQQVDAQTGQCTTHTAQAQQRRQWKGAT